MPRKHVALVTAVAALAAAGCGSSNNSTHSATVSPAPTPAPSSTASASASATSSSPASSTTTQSAASAPTTSSAAGGSASAGPVKIAADPSGGLKYVPSTATASAGKVTIDFTNASAVPHNLNIQEGTNGKVLGKTPTFSHGSKTLTVTLKPGKYTYFCSVPGHRQAGMLGTLTVK